MKKHLLLIVILLLAGCGTVDTAKQQKVAPIKPNEYCAYLVGLVNNGSVEELVSNTSTSSLWENAKLRMGSRYLQSDAVKTQFAQLADVFLKSHFKMLSGFEWYEVKYRDQSSKTVCAMANRYTEEGLNVYTFNIFRSGKNLAVSDFYISGLDQYYSEFVSDHLKAYIQVEDRVGVKASKEKHRALVNFYSAVQKENLDLIEVHYESLADEYKAIKHVILKRADAWSDNEAEFITKMDDLLADYKGNRFSLVFFDYYLLKEQYDDAFRSIELLDKRFKDFYALNFLRSIIYLEMKNEQEFYYYLYRGLENSVTESGAYWVAMEGFMEFEQFEEVLMAVNVLENAYGYMIPAAFFEEEESYKAFTESNYFKKWKQSKI